MNVALPAVIAAKAGIQCRSLGSHVQSKSLGPRFRGDDDQ